MRADLPWLRIALAAGCLLLAAGCAGLRGGRGETAPPGTMVDAGQAGAPLARLDGLTELTPRRRPNAGRARSSIGEGEPAADAPRIALPGDPDHPGPPGSRDAQPLVLNEGAGYRFPVEQGVASYYKRARRTASGKAYDASAATAAHRTLPFGTVALCTLKETGKSVVVTITDRGPHIKGRIIDLSAAAAEKLGMLRLGIGQCELRVLGYPPPPE